MRRARFSQMSDEQLVDLFERMAVAQDQALLMDELSKYNKLFDDMEAIESELRRRPGDQRSRLSVLFGHSNAQVRLSAANATLAVAPELARRVLQQLSDRNEYPQAASARSMISALDAGRYVPE